MKVTVKNAGDSYKVILSYKEQSFTIDYQDATKVEAEFMAKMLRIALKRWKKDLTKNA